MGSLKVSVAVGRGTHYRELGICSECRDYEIKHSVTEGRLGGVGREDPF